MLFFSTIYGLLLNDGDIIDIRHKNGRILFNSDGMGSLLNYCDYTPFIVTKSNYNDSDGYTFISVDGKKILSYDENKNKLRLSYNLISDHTNTFFIKEVGNEIILKNYFNKAATVVNQDIEFKPSNQYDKSQLFRVVKLKHVNNQYTPIEKRPSNLSN